jgi:acetyl-CoA carboxylase carboxyltransferase component
MARLVLPAGPGIRVDTGVSEGDVIPADFDSMIAKIITYGSGRGQALGRLRRALAETTVVIEGGATNKSFLLDLLDQPEVIDARADTGWIDRVRGEGRLAAHQHSGVALAAAAIEACQDEEEVSRQRLLTTAHGGRPQVQHDPGRPLDLKLRGAGYRVRVARVGPERFRVGLSAGGEINIVVAGINVGAQPYWNAEATMLMHTKGILVMTPDSAMVLTGKQSLDFSGGVSAEDNFGIGGYDRVMGPNGQAQYWAPNLAAACGVLMAHYDHTYVAPGETAPRRAATNDPNDRDVSGYPHAMAGSDFATVGQLFSAGHNPDRKKPFDIRTVMRAVSDQDHPVLERWAGMAGADTWVVQDAHIGGWPACLIGIESRAVPRRGFPPADGPDTYTAGTLFPRSSKKTARAINAASGNRPLVVLANLSGFDGSPESMRKLQLQHGAEIGRAIVNFDGPIVFCVISRYHGGAFVVFSKTLNPNMTVLALEGSFASVLGGAPAAAVVFSGEVRNRTATDSRVADLQARAAETSGAERAVLNAALAEAQESVRAEKLGEVAAEFDWIHSIQRAVEVGSVDAIISVAQLRPRIIDAISRGLHRIGAKRHR